MKKFSIYVLVLITSVTIFSFSFTDNGTIIVSVIDIKSSNGEVDLYLFNNKEGFPNNASKAIRHMRGKILQGNCTITIENMSYGTYAISCYHDENNDKMFNKSWYGKPIEGVAVSNNAKGSMSGPPGFEEAQFELNSFSKTLTMKMHYF